MAPVTTAITVGDVFDGYIRKSIMREGGERYTNDPLDRGGETKWGMTAATAKLGGYDGPMVDLDFDTAYSIYRTMFWVGPGFDRIALIHAPLAAFMLDVGINRGPSVPSRWLQRTLNVMNQQGKLWADLLVDGHAGFGTLTALGKYLDNRHAQNGDAVLLFAMRALATVDYIQIAERDATQERFEFGWIAQRAFA